MSTWDSIALGVAIALFGLALYRHLAQRPTGASRRADARFTVVQQELRTWLDRHRAAGDCGINAEATIWSEPPHTATICTARCMSCGEHYRLVVSDADVADLARVHG